MTSCSEASGQILYFVLRASAQRSCSRTRGDAQLHTRFGMWPAAPRRDPPRFPMSLLRARLGRSCRDGEVAQLPAQSCAAGGVDTTVVWTPEQYSPELERQAAAALAERTKCMPPAMRRTFALVVVAGLLLLLLLSQQCSAGMLSHSHGVCVVVWRVSMQACTNGKRRISGTNSTCATQPTSSRTGAWPRCAAAAAGMGCLSTHAAHWCSRDRHYLGTDFPDLARAAAEPVSLLEIGCGVGNAMFPLVEALPCLRAYGLDLSKRAIGFVRDHAAFDPARCGAHVCDVTRCSEDGGGLPTAIRDREPAGVDVALMLFMLSAMPPASHAAALKFAYQVCGGVMAQLVHRASRLLTHVVGDGSL